MRGIHTNLNPYCQHCGDKRKNDNSRMNHERYCSKNPNKIEPLTKGKPSTFRGKKHSQETKEKISNSRKKYLNDNPEMVPYKLNHYSKGPSYPEQYFRGVFEGMGIDFVEQHQIGLYCLDFAFLDKKIDLEIDGEQHYLDERIIKSDDRRNKFLENLDWKIIRIRWSRFKKLNNLERKEFIGKLIEDIK
jgi:Protein of unknown function (DUF559)/NUMOD3 motif